MPNIKPISDLENYTEVLNEVTEESPVYLARNGRSEYDKLKAEATLLEKLEEGEKSAREKEWISADAVETLLGL